MSQILTLTTYFRARDGDNRAFGSPDYLAGFEDDNGESWGVAVPLEPDDVEPEVLRGVRFSILMGADGSLSIEAEGLGDAAVEAIARSGPMAHPSLDDLVRSALEPKLLAMEDDAEIELKTLQTRLARALALVGEALGRLKR